MIVYKKNVELSRSIVKSHYEQFKSTEYLTKRQLNDKHCYYLELRLSYLCEFGPTQGKDDTNEQWLYTSFFNRQILVINCYGLVLQSILVLWKSQSRLHF